MEPTPLQELFVRLLLFGQAYEVGELPAPYTYSLSFGPAGESEGLGPYDAVVKVTVELPVELSASDAEMSAANVLPVEPT